MKMTSADFQEACNSFDGYCKTCDTVTEWGGIEPDAMRYKCDECGKRTVFGIENALLMGFIDIDDSVQCERVESTVNVNVNGGVL